MSKARTRALTDLCASIARDAGAESVPAEAICALIEDGLGSLERIALALEKIAAPPEAVLGEAIQIEAPLSPEMVERGVKALEEIAAKLPAA